MEIDVSAVCKLIEGNADGTSRSIIGIAGPPASGKSTLAEAVVQRLNKDAHESTPIASLLPMDGYHLDNRILESRGLLARKGAPETFDAHGFCDALKRLSTAKRETYFPRFDRQLDLAVANSIAIRPETAVIVVEGNYLLLKDDPWSSLQNIFTTSVFVCPTIDELRDRLIQRWIDHGLDQEAAIVRATGNDLQNAELVIQNSYEADMKLTQNYTEFGVRFAY